MERREFVTALGAAAAAISVSQAFAEESPVEAYASAQIQSPDGERRQMRVDGQ